MNARKTVLTTGEVAKICNVAPRTVSKWFDSGQLRGYRIPGSKDRRIPADQLIAFLRAHNMPLDGLESGHKRVLVYDADRGTADAIQTALAEQGDYEVRTASSAFEAGALAHEFTPHILILDNTLPDIDPKAISRCIRGAAELRDLRLIGTATGLTDGQGQALLQDGFDGYLGKPFEIGALVRLIEELASC